MKIENLRESDNIFTYKEMSILADTSPENFLKMSKRYEDKLRKEGWQYTKEGKGKKAIYYVKDELKKKSWEELTFKERFKELYDINIKYPLVMESYMESLKDNMLDVRIISDKNAGIVLDYSRQKINYCRKKLELAGLIVPLKEQVDARYFIYGNEDKNYEVEEIHRKEYSGYWKKYFDDLKYDMAIKGYVDKNQIICEKDIMDEIRKRAINDLEAEIEGYLVKIKIKEPTDKFYDDYDRLFS